MAPNYRAVAASMATKYGVPVDVFLKQINQESGFNPAARSGAGAQGIAQFMPATAKQYGVNTADPISSLDGAARMDAGLIKKYGVAGALSAYNSGNPNAYKDPNFAHGQTYNYVRSIMGGAPISGGAGAGIGPPAAPAAAGLAARPAAAPVYKPPPNPLPGLLTSLQGSGNDMSGFYRQLGAVLQQRGHMVPGAPAAAKPGQPAATPIAPGSTGIAKTALTQLGTPYQWGGKAALGSRTDCSGLLQASARANGINIGRTTYQQYKQGSPVPLNQLLPGDAVFFHPGPNGPEHVAIFIGGGRIVEDPRSGESVHITALAGRGPMGARRYG